MPRDLRLDPTTHDIDLVGGIVLTKPGAESLAQNVKVALLLRTNEWAPNINIGVPYLSALFRAKNNKAFVDSFFRSYIQNVPGVLRIASYTSTLDAQRKLNIRFTTIQEQQPIEVTV